MTRSYTLDDIDRMRKAVEMILRPSGAYYEAEQIRKIEEHLRTYMAAGIDPDDLVVRSIDAQNAHFRREEEMRRMDWEYRRAELEPKGAEWDEENKCIVWRGKSLDEVWEAVDSSYTR